MTSLHGEWKRMGDVDTTGGPTTVPPQPTNILQAATAATSNNASAAKLPPVTPAATEPAAEGAVATSPSHAAHHVKENPKWSQNPQFHIQLNQIYGNTEEVYLKIVVRKHESSHHHSKLHKQKSAANSGGFGSSSGNAASGGGNNAGDEKKANATIGLTVVKADVYEENASKSKKKVPRQNKLGEVNTLF